MPHGRCHRTKVETRTNAMTALVGCGIVDNELIITGAIIGVGL